MPPLLLYRLHRLASRLGLSLSGDGLHQVLACLHLLTDDDFALLTEAFYVLPTSDVAQWVQQRAFHVALSSFITVSGMPRTNALAYLRAGLPVRRLVLPPAARRQLGLALVVRDMRIFVCELGTGNLLGVDLRNMSVPDIASLIEAARDRTG